MAKYKIGRDAQTGKFVMDGAYVRVQAREAIKTFVSPYTGIYEAVTGKERRYVSRDSSTGRFVDTGKPSKPKPKT